MRKTAPSSVPAPAAKRARRRSSESQAQFKQELVSFAKTLFREQGSEAVSIRALTDAFGMSAMSFYGYFDSKQDLITHIWIDFFKELLDSLLVCGRGQRSPRQVIEAHVRAYIGYWEAHPDHYRMVYVAGGMPHGDAPVSLNEHPVYEQMVDLWNERILACAQGASVPQRTVRLIGDLMFVKALGYLHATLAVERYPFVDRERLRREVIRDIVETTELVARG